MCVTTTTNDVGDEEQKRRKHPLTKLSMEDREGVVVDARGGMSQRALAVKYGCSRSVVRRIISEEYRAKYNQHRADERARDVEKAREHDRSRYWSKERGYRLEQQRLYRKKKKQEGVVE